MKEYLGYMDTSSDLYACILSAELQNSVWRAKASIIHEVVYAYRISAIYLP